MRIIIAGGTGFIGKALTTELIKEDHEVVLLSRATHPDIHQNKSVTIQQWDGVSSQGWEDQADGAGAIINLAGESIGGTGFLPHRWTPSLKKRILQSRITTTTAIIQAIKKAKKKPDVLIQSSAVGFYGVHNDEEITEESPAGSDFLADVCVKWEAASAEADDLNVRRVIIRTGLPLSKDGGIFTRLVLPFKLFAGGPLGNGQQYMPWISMQDYLASIIFLLKTASAMGPFNLTAPNPVKNIEFARLLGKAMRRPSFMPAPGFAFKLAFGEVSTLILEGQRVIPKRLQEAGFVFQYPTLESVLPAFV